MPSTSAAKEMKKQAASRKLNNYVASNEVSKSRYEICKSRYEICKKCEHFQKRFAICKMCGCFMRIKTRLLKTNCPINKWSSS